ncbi:MAG: 4-hydroxythreonine-4-phosphate dehydrogenase PdxA [Alphaproteobacteria bacterium]|nr:4-hydroxythreonine-4-phosphate dehydrogenase PdxA [Alphaproteobacteria bacterium]
MPISRPAETARRQQAPVLITMGEPGGVGPELAVRAYDELNGQIAGHPLRLVGDPDVFLGCGAQNPRVLLDSGRAPAGRRPGHAAPENAQSVAAAIAFAVAEVTAGRAAALVTGPIQKEAMQDGGFSFPGHTEYLAALTGAPRAVMMLAGPYLRVVPLTIHIPLAEVPAQITREAVTQTARIVLDALVRDFAIVRPRLAVAGLNPHAGEGGHIGHEDALQIRPAVAALQAEGYDVRGPLPADTLFHAEARRLYDAALCMYHDQALIPIKTLHFWDAVNVTLGLPVVRTSPDHGTALDLAGSGRADVRSTLAAITLAAEIADARMDNLG